MKNNVRFQNFLFFIIAGIVIYYLASCTSRKKEKRENYDDSKIKFYGRTSCPFTVQMKELLKNDSRFVYIEITGDEGKEIPAVPYFYNPKNGKEVVGAHKSSNEIFQKLQ